MIQNFASPSRAENRQASAKLTISPSNAFNLNWENQILDSETFYNCCKSTFPKKRFCMEMIWISSISSYLLSCFQSLVRQLDVMNLCMSPFWKAEELFSMLQLKNFSHRTKTRPQTPIKLNFWRFLQILTWNFKF